MTKPHAMTGQRNAAKTVTKDAIIQLRLPMADKNIFTRHAQSKGLTLSSWILGGLKVLKNIEDEQK